MYQTVEDQFYLIPTAETPLTNFFRDEILDETALPVYRCAYTRASGAKLAATARMSAGSTVSINSTRSSC